MDTMICLLKFRITTRDPYVSVEIAWVAIKSQLQAGSLSTYFLTSLDLASFLVEVKRAFTTFHMAHHNLGSSREMLSHLEGFTSNSNKCHKDCFPKLKCLRLTKRFSLNPKFWFITNRLKISQRCWGEVSKALGWVFSLVEPAASKGGRGRSFYIVPPKTSCWKLASRNWNIQF
jgi:hypothetical protein